MKLKCQKCGSTRFYASQAVRGTITVIVDENSQFLDNTTGDGHIDSSGLDFDDPEGPFVCVDCGTAVE